jgi:thermitase
MSSKTRFPVTLIFLIMAVFFLGTFFSLASAEEKFTPVRGKDLFVPGEYIVSYRGMFFESKTMATQMAAATCQGVKMTITKVGKFAPILRCRLKEGENFETVKAALLKNKRIRSVEPNYIAWVPEPELKPGATGTRTSPGDAGALTQTSDPLLLEQWGYYKIQADYTPDLPTSAPTIAVIDTGVDYNHPDLIGKVTKGPDLVNGDKDPMDDAGHGTHVAGIAAAISNNGIGIAGISGKSKIYAVKVLCSQMWGTYDDIVDGVYYAANLSDVKVINMSLGGYGDSDALHIAVQYAVTIKGKLVVAAAGNENTNTKLYPAAYPEVIAVAASDVCDDKASYSNYGNTWVDIAAPGGDKLVDGDGGIVSTVPFFYPGQYDWFEGTSMASPFVAGAAARLWAANPALTNTQVRSNLEASGDSLAGATGAIWPEEPTFKRLNLYNALGLVPINTRARVSGYFLDAVTGLGALGAKVEALQGTLVKSVDYVPTDGYASIVIDPGTNYRFRISKAKSYPTLPLPGPSDPAMTFIAGDDIYIGVFPIAPAVGTWQLTLGWDDDSKIFDAYLFVPNFPFYWIVGREPIGGFADSVGNMNVFPYARWNRDPVMDGIPVESISVKKTLSGTYYFAVNNMNNDDIKAANAKVAIYQKTKCVAVLFASDASGDANASCWYIGRMVGSTFYPINELNEIGPYSLSASGQKISLPIAPPGSRPTPEKLSKKLLP